MDEIDIIRDPGDEDSGRRFGEKGEGKVLEMVIESLPHVRYNPQADIVHQVSLTVIKDAFQEKEENDGNGEQIEHLRILFKKDIVKSRLDKECLAGCQEGDKEHTAHRQAHFDPVRFNEVNKPTVVRHVDDQDLRYRNRRLGLILVALLIALSIMTIIIVITHN